MKSTTDLLPGGRLHVGCGTVVLPGWINIDVKPYPGVDCVIDVSSELPFSDVEYIFAEHFIEHLPLPSARAFLALCRSALREDGVLRLSTPNLDWVWSTHYRDPGFLSPPEARVACLEINRAFHGWGHRFLYNSAILEEALKDAGFSMVEFTRYGESRHPALRNLERHPRSSNTERFPDVLVAEASGRGSERPSFAQLIDEYARDLAID